MMKICIIAEGSYPYTIGGVSSWVQSVILSFPQHEFSIVAIGADGKDRGKFKYKIPANVRGIYENFLDSYKFYDGNWGKKFDLDEKIRNAVENLICCRQTDWKDIFNIVKQDNYVNVVDFLMSCDYYDIIQRACETKYKNIPFHEVFWNARSLLLPLFETIDINIPYADVYHCVSTGYAGIAGVIAKMKYGKPLLITEHGIYVREREEDIVKSTGIVGYFKKMWIQYFMNIAKYTYDYADKVITLFEKNKEFEIKYGCDEKKIRIVPNGIDLKKFEYGDRSDRKDDTINIGAFLRVVPIKDIITMIQGFAIARRINNKLKLYIMGPTNEDPDYYQECKNDVENLNLQEDVIFTGNVQTANYIKSMDIIVLTSISEGQPLSILEGMASKKPCVATDVGSCKSLLYGDGDSFGKAGFIVPVMNSMAFAESLLKLSWDKKLRIQMGEAGYMRVHRFYDINMFVESYHEIYSEYEAR